MLSLRNLFLVIAIIAPAPLWAQTPRYTISDLGLPVTALIAGINDHGDVAGNFASGNGGFLIRNGVMQTWDVQTSIPTSYGTVVTGINNSGQVSGYRQYSSSFVPQSGFVYTEGKIQWISPDTYTYVSGISDDGTVIGEAGDYFAGTPFQAFASKNGVTTNLGFLVTTGSRSSSANAINSSGDIVGFATIPNSTGRAFLYHNGTMQAIAGLDTNAIGINDLGQVVGGPATLYAGTAFLYSGGVLYDLGTLGVGSRAIDINNRGQIVGYYNLESNGRAFIYENGTMYDLTSLIDPSLGWTLQDVTGINELGQIVGSGLLGGVRHPFVLTPVAVPEPSTALLGFGGIATLAAFRLLRRRLRGVTSPTRKNGGCASRG